MGKASLRNLLAHKGRLALSLLAVVLSAGFVAGTLIFTDTLKASFDDLFAGTASDVVVSPPDTDGPSSDGSDGSSVGAAHRPRVGARDGRARPKGSPRPQGTSSRSPPRSSARTASPSASGGGPTFGVNWIE